MKKLIHSLRKPGLLLLGVSLLTAPAFLGKAEAQTSAQAEKELYIPKDVREAGDLNSDTCEYSYKRMKQTPNLAIFWAKKYGYDPINNPDTTQRFDPDYILKEGERVYQYYVNDLKFVKKGHSVTDKYKCVIFIVDSKDATAYGGGVDDLIGCFWAPAVRMHKAPFGAMAHEMGHSFQYMLNVDKEAERKELEAKGLLKKETERGRRGGGGGGGWIEMTAQFLLWQVYPTWMTFENYHLVDFMKQTHLAFMHGSNMYHSPYVMEYWANLHGPQIISRIYQEGEAGEDPVMTYKRLTGLDQKKFNDEIFEGYRRFMTWDMKRIESYAKPYANQHYSKLDDMGDGWYRIAESKCPQNYGYNGIKLQVPAAGTRVTLDFKGLAGSEGFHAIKVDKAGWRYGFVAVKEDGSRVYPPMGASKEGKLTFSVPEKTKYLWLVVSGAPTVHWGVSWDKAKEEQWPYKIKLTGTSVDVSAMK